MGPANAASGEKQEASEPGLQQVQPLARLADALNGAWTVQRQVPLMGWQPSKQGHPAVADGALLRQGTAAAVVGAASARAYAAEVGVLESGMALEEALAVHDPAQLLRRVEGFLEWRAAAAQLPHMKDQHCRSPLLPREVARILQELPRMLPPRGNCQSDAAGQGKRAEQPRPSAAKAVARIVCHVLLPLLQQPQQFSGLQVATCMAALERLRDALPMPAAGLKPGVEQLLALHCPQFSADEALDSLRALALMFRTAANQGLCIELTKQALLQGGSLCKARMASLFLAHLVAETTAMDTIANSMVHFSAGSGVLAADVLESTAENALRAGLALSGLPLLLLARQCLQLQPVAHPSLQRKLQKLLEAACPLAVEVEAQALQLLLAMGGGAAPAAARILPLMDRVCTRQVAGMPLDAVLAVAQLCAVALAQPRKPPRAASQHLSELLQAATACALAAMSFGHAHRLPGLLWALKVSGCPPPASCVQLLLDQLLLLDWVSTPHLICLAWALGSGSLHSAEALSKVAAAAAARAAELSRPEGAEMLLVLGETSPALRPLFAWLAGLGADAASGNSASRPQASWPAAAAAAALPAPEDTFPRPCTPILVSLLLPGSSASLHAEEFRILRYVLLSGSCSEASGPSCRPRLPPHLPAVAGAASAAAALPVGSARASNLGVSYPSDSMLGPPDINRLQAVNGNAPVPATCVSASTFPATFSSAHSPAIPPLNLPGDPSDEPAPAGIGAHWPAPGDIGGIFAARDAAVAELPHASATAPRASPAASPETSTTCGDLALSQVLQLLHKAILWQDDDLFDRLLLLLLGHVGAMHWEDTASVAGAVLFEARRLLLVDQAKTAAAPPDRLAGRLGSSPGSEGPWPHGHQAASQCAGALPDVGDTESPGRSRFLAGLRQLVCAIAARVGSPGGAVPQGLPGEKVVLLLSAMAAVGDTAPVGDGCSSSHPIAILTKCVPHELLDDKGDGMILDGELSTPALACIAVSLAALGFHSGVLMQAIAKHLSSSPMRLELSTAQVFAVLDAFSTLYGWETQAWTPCAHCQPGSPGGQQPKCSHKQRRLVAWQVQLQTRLMRQALQGIGRASASDVVGLVRRADRWRCKDRHIMGTVASEMAMRPPTSFRDVPASELAKLAIAYAWSRSFDSRMFRVVAASVAGRLEMLEPRDVSGMAWAFSMGNYHDVALFQQIEAFAYSHLEVFTPQEVSSLIAAFGGLRHPCPQLCAQVSDFLMRNIEHTELDRQVYIVKALVQLGAAEKRILDCVAAQMLALDSLSSSGASAVSPAEAGAAPTATEGGAATPPSQPQALQPWQAREILGRLSCPTLDHSQPPAAGNWLGEADAPDTTAASLPGLSWQNGNAVLPADLHGFGDSSGSGLSKLLDDPPQQPPRPHGLRSGSCTGSKASRPLHQHPSSIAISQESPGGQAPLLTHTTVAPASDPQMLLPLHSVMHQKHRMQQHQCLLNSSGSRPRSGAGASAVATSNTPRESRSRAGADWQWQGEGQVNIGVGILKAARQVMLAHSNLKRLNRERLVDLLYTYTVARYQDLTLVLVVSAALIPLTHRCKPLELGKLAWSLSNLNLYDRAAFELVSETAVARISEFRPQQLSFTAWSFAHIGHHDPVLFSALGQEACRGKVKGMEPPELVDFAWGMATMRCWDTELFVQIAYWQCCRFDALQEDDILLVRTVFLLWLSSNPALRPSQRKIVEQLQRCLAGLADDGKA